VSATAARNDGPALLTRRELAESLRICTKTLMRLEQLGQVPKPIRIGKQVRYRRSDLAHLLGA
jgi:predicted DNA-binding transcriptional regulator AlpA